MKEILSKVDHTLLAQTATWGEIKTICDDAVTYQTASVCIPASYVRQAKDYLGDKMAVCTVIGFPNGYSTTAVKCFETSDAVANGADEIDMYKGKVIGVDVDQSSIDPCIITSAFKGLQPTVVATLTGLAGGNWDTTYGGKFLTMLLSLVTLASAADKTYTDAAVIEQNGQTEAVDVLSYLGILNGYGDGAFRTNQGITRAEAAKIIAMRTLTLWRSRFTSVTVPRPSGVSTNDSFFGEVRSRSS